MDQQPQPLTDRIAEALTREDVHWGYHCNFGTAPDDDMTRAYVAAVAAEVEPELAARDAEIAKLREQVAQWQRRATRAEGAMRHALWMSPLAYNNETAEAMTTRFRLHIEATYPDLVTRYSHQPVEVFQWADGCSCEDDGSNEYENAHSETDDNDDAICSRTPLGRVCDSCEDEDGDGPEWLPGGVLWPCPPIAELNQLTDAGVLAAAMTPAPAARPADDVPGARPMTVMVQRPAGEHVSEADAEWIRARLNRP